MEKQSYTAVKILALITYIGMIAVNVLADLIPLGGATTRQIAEQYPNLFVPTPFTFSIWGVIYLLLALYTLYLLGLFRGKDKSDNPELMRKTGTLFSVSSILNVAWIIAWHYDMTGLSVIIILLLLLCLILINNIIKKEELTAREKFFVGIPFSVYFGWITIAVIANITAFLVSIGFSGFGISDTVWTIIILIAGAIIGIAVILTGRNIAYRLVMIWAYSGILIKHISAGGFDGQYPSVILTTVICLILFVLAIAYVFISDTKKAKRR